MAGDGLGELRAAIDGGAGMVGRHVGRYRIERPIGRGGTGVVYLARNIDSGMPVAVKLLRPAHGVGETGRQRFRRSCRLAAAIEHHRIVSIIDGDFDGATPYVVMSYVEGCSLAELLADRERLTPDEARATVRELAGALAVLHGRGLVHRDVKPSNVLVSEDGALMLSDFDLLRPVEDEAAGNLTRVGTAIGTASYMSPEQVRGRDIDARADIWALGALWFELLTGAPPFGRGTLVQLAGRILDTLPPLLAMDGLLPDEARLIGDMLAREPMRRPTDGKMLLERIERLGLREKDFSSGFWWTVPERRRPPLRRRVSDRLAAMGREGYRIRIGVREVAWLVGLILACMTVGLWLGAGAASLPEGSGASLAGRLPASAGEPPGRSATKPAAAPRARPAVGRSQGAQSAEIAPSAPSAEPPRVLFVKPASFKALVGAEIPFNGRLEGAELARLRIDGRLVPGTRLTGGVSVFAGRVYARGREGTVAIPYEVLGTQTRGELVVVIDATPPRIELAGDLDAPIYTKQGAIELTGRVVDAHPTAIYDGAQRVAVGPDGSFRIVCALGEAGPNTLTLIAEDGAGARSAPLEVVAIRDDAPPGLAVESVTSTPEQVVFVGRVTDASPIASLELDGRPVEIDADGAFRVVVPPGSSSAPMQLACVDAAGNVATQALYRPESNRPSPSAESPAPSSAQAAELLVIDPPLPAEVHGASARRLSVSGRIGPNVAKVTVNGEDARLEGAEFSTRVRLEEGVNPVAIAALDASGRLLAATEASVRYTARPPKAFAVAVWSTRGLSDAFEALGEPNARAALESLEATASNLAEPLSRVSRTDLVALRVKGWFEVPRSGTYRLQVSGSSPYRLRVVVRDKEVADESHGRSINVPVALKKGEYPIVVEVVQHPLSVNLSAQLVAPDGSFTILRPSRPAPPP